MWTAERARVLGWLLVAPSVLLGVAGFALHAVGGWPDVAAAPPTVIGVTNGVALSVVGALIVDHKPHNSAGWIVVATGLLLAAMGFVDGVALAVDPGGVAAPAAELVWVGNVLGMVAFVGGQALLFVFPDGWPPAGRWRRVFVVSGIAAIVTVVVQSAAAWTVRGEVLSGYHVFYVEDVSGASPAFVVTVLGERLIQLGWLVGVVALLRRYVRSRGVARQQLSWGVLGLGATGLVLSVGYVVVGPGVQLVAGIPVVVGVLIAMRRHRLFDAERIVRRALLYAALTVVLAGGFAAIVVGLGAVAGSLGVTTSVAVAAATLAAAAAANPLRRTLQRQLDRRFDQRTWQAVAAVEAFTNDLRDGTAAPADLPDVLRGALGEASVQIAYFLPDGSLVDGDGRPVEPSGASDRSAQVVLIGGRRVALVDLPAALVAAEPRLVEAALSAAALPLENAALHAGAALQLAEVQHSRRRIVEAGDAERRRIERDLHDGAQQRLVAATLRLRRIERRLANSDPQTAAQLDATIDELRASLDELRDLTRGILPPVLADEGLAVALRSITTTLPIPVTLDVTPERLPATIEATAWFLVSEGLANAVKHAHANHLAARVQHRNGHVRVEVTDDGRGGATITPGGGLQGLADRVAAVGGRFKVLSPTTGGTTLVAELKCES